MPLFLQRYARYVEPVAYTYAYCLLRNRFHFLVRTRTPEEYEDRHETLKVSETFRVLSQGAGLVRRAGQLRGLPYHRGGYSSYRAGAALDAVHLHRALHGPIGPTEAWPNGSGGDLGSR